MVKSPILRMPFGIKRIVPLILVILLTIETGNGTRSPEINDEESEADDNLKVKSEEGEGDSEGNSKDISVENASENQENPDSKRKPNKIAKSDLPEVDTNDTITIDATHPTSTPSFETVLYKTTTIKTELTTFPAVFKPLVVPSTMLPTPDSHTESQPVQSMLPNQYVFLAALPARTSRAPPLAQSWQPFFPFFHHKWHETHESEELEELANHHDHGWRDPHEYLDYYDFERMDEHDHL